MKSFAIWRFRFFLHCLSPFLIFSNFISSITGLELEGSGYVVASLGEDSGYVPYTAYSAKKSYLEKNPETIQKFTNAIQKGLDYVNSHSAEEIAQTIQPQFKKWEYIMN